MKWFKKLKILFAHVWKDIAGSFKSPKPVFVITLAVLLILVGQIGIFVPFFPGLILTLPGLVLLSLYSPTIYSLVKKKVSKHPKIESATDRTRNWLINWIKPRQ